MPKTLFNGIHKIPAMSSFRSFKAQKVQFLKLMFALVEQKLKIFIRAFLRLPNKLLKNVSLGELINPDRQIDLYFD